MMRVEMSYICSFIREDYTFILVTERYMTHLYPLQIKMCFLTITLGIKNTSSKSEVPP